MEWYRELFQPGVAAGIIPAGALAGHRNEAVYLRTPRYVPPRWEAVRDTMPELFELLENESHPGVRAVLGHWLFGYIHPYPDGNGRIARLVMNAMLASGGYPSTVIRVEDRDAYLSALDRASIDMDIAPFTTFVADRVPRGQGPSIGSWSAQEVRGSLSVASRSCARTGIGPRQREDRSSRRLLDRHRPLLPADRLRRLRIRT
jgi:hypothetical protein